MEKQRQDFFPFLIALGVLVAVSAPFIYASTSAGEVYRFGGFLLNPLDGYSYLAKMHQGWEGNWRYRMAFSAQPGDGVYIQLLYIFLGHVSRLTNLPMLVIFHTARLMGALLLLSAIWHFFGRVLPNPRARRLGFALAALGSGMGWLTVPFGVLPADMWVAEAYPFLSAYSNPHFTLSLALVLWLIVPVEERISAGRVTGVLLASLLLSVISPFGVILGLMIQGGAIGVRSLLDQSWRRLPDLLTHRDVRIAGLTFAGGAPFLIYDYWITRSDLVIAQWNAQNLTPSPPLWDLFISLSPVLILAVIGAGFAIKNSGMKWVHQPLFVFIVWAGLGLALVYAPFDLQRRFMMGIYIPLAGLTAVALDLISSKYKSYRFWATLLFILAIPTNLVVLMAGYAGIQMRAETIYLSHDEDLALRWIAENSAQDALVLSSPEMGSFIPAITGRRVIYGHPFETINAAKEAAAVEAFFGAEIQPDDARAFLAERQVDFVFYGPREHALGEKEFGLNLLPVFTSGEVTLYLVEH